MEPRNFFSRTLGVGDVFGKGVGSFLFNFFSIVRLPGLCLRRGISNFYDTNIVTNSQKQQFVAAKTKTIEVEYISTELVCTRRLVASPADRTSCVLMHVNVTVFCSTVRYMISSIVVVNNIIILLRRKKKYYYTQRGVGSSSS